MWCFISQPNSVVLEVQVDPKARGQECLEKVCQSLGIGKECDYFGLKLQGCKGEESWLNLRNPIERQVAGLPPHRFAFRVKFWVPPHLLLQDATRHQFYLHAKLDILEGHHKVSDMSIMAKLVALMVQADVGNCDSVVIQNLSHVVLGEKIENLNDFMQLVADCHCKIQDMKSAAAEYWLLKELSYLESFGQEMFCCRVGVPGPIIGVGPHGVTLYQHDNHDQSIPFTAILSAEPRKRTFQMKYLDIDGQETILDLKMESTNAASSLYRCLTEKHSFYSCETVRSAVTDQYIRDLKGTIVSIFNEDTSLGKKYVFDIQRTCREVYDNARRAMYQPGCEAAVPKTKTDNAIQMNNSCPECHGNCKGSQILTRVLEAMSCRICMDRTIDTIFISCMHLIACATCASRCDRCPLCRSSIEQCQRVSLPFDHSEVFSADISVPRKSAS